MADHVNRQPSRGRPWTAADRTGGPIDQALDQLRQEIPDLVVERLLVTHPADDDNVFFVGRGEDLDCVQVDTGPDGQPPFFIEDGGRWAADDPAEVAEIIRGSLSQSSSGGGCPDGGLAS